MYVFDLSDNILSGRQQLDYHDGNTQINTCAGLARVEGGERVAFFIMEFVADRTCDASVLLNNAKLPADLHCPTRRKQWTRTAEDAQCSRCASKVNMLVTVLYYYQLLLYTYACSDVAALEFCGRSSPLSSADLACIGLVLISLFSLLYRIFTITHSVLI
jgi:hypothetical protein